jgi:glycosyltransferase involved in cell wall biosynthesis
MEQQHIPKVSVIIPTCSRPVMLREAIASVLAQSFKDIEILVVDDDPLSVPSAEEVVSSFCDERLRYVKHEKKCGAPAARNTGIRLSRGAYISFLDDDDTLRQDFVEKMASALDRLPLGTGVLHCAQAYHDPEGKILFESRPRHRGWIRPALLRGEKSSGIIAMVRRECFEVCGGFDETLPSGQDWEMWLRISEKFAFDHIPDVLADVMVHGTRISSDINKIISGRERILERHRPLMAQMPGVLEIHLKRLGKLNALKGDWKASFSWFAQAIRLNWSEAFKISAWFVIDFPWAERLTASVTAAFVFAVFLLVTSAGYFLQWMSGPVMHDEQHYVSAGILLKHFVLYQDIPFFQTPYLAYIYHFVFRLTGESFYLLKARVITFLFLAMAMFALFCLLRRLAKDRAVAAMLVGTSLMSMLLFRNAAWADNNIPAMAFLAIGILFLIKAFEGPKAVFCYLVSGMMFMAAAGTKLFYLPLMAPAVLVLWRGENTRVNVKWWWLGVCLGALPVIIPACVYPVDFFFCNIKYHQLTAAWLIKTGEGTGVLLMSSLQELIRRLFFRPSNFLLIGMCLGSVATLGLRWRSLGQRQGLVWVLFSGGLLTTGLFCLLLPRPLYPQHMILLLVPMLMMPAAVFGVLSVEDKRRIKNFLLAICMLACVFSFKTVASFLVRPKPWTGIELAKASAAIKLEQGTAYPTVITLAPLFALESGMVVRTDMSTGPFFYRLGTEGLRDASWQVAPPDIIITGFEDDLDVPLNDFAQNNGYQKIDGEWMGAVVYLKKKGAL